MTLRNKIATAIVAIGIGANAYAQNNIETFLSNENEKSRVRTNIFWKLPGDIKVFSWCEFKPNSYLQKNIITKDFLKQKVGATNLNFGAIIETVHCNAFKDNYGTGIQINLKKKGKHVSHIANAKCVPFFVNKDGHMKNKNKRGLIGGAYIGNYLIKDRIDVNVTAFCQFDYAKGIWSYGEGNIGIGIRNKKHPHKPSKIRMGGGADLFPKGDALPRIVPKAMVKYNF